MEHKNGHDHIGMPMTIGSYLEFTGVGLWREFNFRYPDLREANNGYSHRNRLKCSTFS